MITYDNAAAIAAAPTDARLDPDLRKLLAARVHDWAATELLDLTHVLVVERGDDEQAILDEIPFSPLFNPLNESRFGAPDFEAPFQWLSVHGGWAEVIATISNDGFGFHIFIDLAPAADPDLLALVGKYEQMNEDGRHG